MPPYPRDSSHALGLLALKCFITHGERTETINRLVQHGIDQYAISLTNDEGWKAYGGFGNGRKWPILFAGLVLDDSSMQSPPLMVNDNSVFKFGEDGHTYQGDTQPLWGQDCAVDGINSPWFSNHDCRDPDGVVEADPNPYRDDEGMVNDGGYRICCTSHTWVCSALAARLMGAVTTWNHTPFFDYMDRWVAEPLCFFDSSTEAKQDLYGYGGTQNLFAKKMWEDYR
jgi:hypothetical protein